MATSDDGWNLIPNVTNNRNIQGLGQCAMNEFANQSGDHAEFVGVVRIWLRRKPDTRYPNPKNPSPNPKSPNPKNPNPNPGSNPRYPKLIRVVRVLGHGTRNTRTTRNDLFFHLWFDLCASKLCLLIVICEVWTVTVWTCEVLVNFVWTVSLDVWTGCMVGCIWFDFILHMWSSRISGNSGKTRTRTRTRIFGYPNFRVLLFPNWFRVSFLETRNS